MLHSYLYVPADRPELAAKAARSGTHAVIVDLEDGVAPAARDVAHDAAGDAIAAARADGLATLVRVHPDHLERGLNAAVLGGVEGVYLPKAELASIAACDELLGSLHGALGGSGTTSDIELVALVESAQGLLDAPAAARHPRVVGLALGESDLIADLGAAPDLDPDERRALRLQLVVASAAAGLRGPTAPASTDYRDLDAFRASCVELRRLGFSARSAVHPAQVPVINEVFAPDADELAAARALVDAFDAAAAEGRGVLVGEDGRMIDEAVVRSARRLLA